MVAEWMMNTPSKENGRRVLQGKTPYKHQRPFCIAKQHTPLPKAYIYLIQCVIGLLTRAVQNCFNAQNRAFSMDESINDRLSPSILSSRHTVPGSVPDSHRIPSFSCRVIPLRHKITTQHIHFYENCGRANPFHNPAQLFYHCWLLLSSEIRMYRKFNKSVERLPDTFDLQFISLPYNSVVK